MSSLNPNKVVLGMSGGVDSSISLMLLKKAGFEVVGVSLQYDVYKCSKRKENVCCSKESFEIAKKVCHEFGCKHEIINVSELFDKEVIGYFKSELEKFRTPSPCVFCNPKVKFATLLHFADEMGAKYVATGHYAKISEIELEGKKQLALMQGADQTKDQTYSLSFLAKENLGRVIFPLGDLNKDEVYELAKQNKIFNIYKKIKQSQDFCFIDSDELGKFIDKEIKPDAGNIVDESGNILGRHEGLSHYTIGQRKGICLPGGPYYVADKKTPNILVVSRDVDKTMAKGARLKPYNLTVDLEKKNYSVFVKARSTEVLRPAEITLLDDYIKLEMKEAIQLVPGQIAVFYQDDEQSGRKICLGSGVINH